MGVLLDAAADRRLRKRLDKAAYARLGRHLGRLAARLEADPTLGDDIARSRWPDRFSDFGNLWRAELPGAWRALYTIASYPGRDLEVVIVWVGDHTAYDRLFGYG